MEAREKTGVGLLAGLGWPCCFLGAHFAEARSEEPLCLSHFPSSHWEIFYLLSNITNGKHIISEEISSEARGQPYLSESLNFECKIKRSMSLSERRYGITTIDDFRRETLWYNYHR